MKSKTCFFLISTLCITTLASAQSWFQDGKAWVHNWGWWGSGGYEELAVLPGDISINGMDCKSLSRRLHYAYYDATNDTYHVIDEEHQPITLCQLGDSIFAKNYLDEWVLQFDFSLEPGDSLIYYYSSEPVYALVLESVGTETIQNQTLRTQRFKAHLLSNPGTTNYDGMSFKIIETIGMVESEGGWNQVSYLIPMELFNSGADYPSYSLRCALGADYEYKLVDDCYGLLLGTDEQDDTETQITIHPNPATSAFWIQHSPTLILKEARIYAMNGSLQFATRQLDGPIQISELPQGVYLLVVESELGIFRKKLMVNR